MNRRLRKYSKLIIIFIGAVLVLQSFVFSMENTKPIELESLDADDERIATELSNMTGITKEEILRLKYTGRSWNEVMEALKNTNNINMEMAKNHNRLLAETGIGDEFIKELENLGYTVEEILEAKMLVERLHYQLQEILKIDNQVNPNSLINIATHPNETENLEVFEKISNSVSSRTLLYLILALEDELGSKEAVLDEYLLSIQLDLNLEDYVANKEQYIKLKQEKNIVSSTELVTLSILEGKMLEKLQQQNSLNRVESLIIGGKGIESNETSVTNPLPEIPLPNVNNIKPNNPLEEIQKELNSLNPNHK